MTRMRDLYVGRIQRVIENIEHGLWQISLKERLLLSLDNLVDFERIE